MSIRIIPPQWGGWGWPTTIPVPINQWGTWLTSIAAKSIWAADAANVLIALSPWASQSIRINAAWTAWELFTPSAGWTPWWSPQTIQFNDSWAFGWIEEVTWNWTDKIFDITIIDDEATPVSSFSWAVKNTAETESSYFAITRTELLFQTTWDAIFEWWTMSFQTWNNVFSYFADNGTWIHDYASLTDDRTFTFPDDSGTIALTSDLALYAPINDPIFTWTVILPKDIQIQDTSATHQYIFAVSELAADRTVTLPLLIANDTFVFADHIQTLAGKTLTKPTVNASIEWVVALTDWATVTADLATANMFTVTIAGNRTMVLSNASIWQIFNLRIQQDWTWSRTVTWFTTIKRAGWSAPTLTTTAGKADSFIFVCTDSGTYDGFIVGQNI